MALKDWNLAAAEEAGQQAEMKCIHSIYREELYEGSDICALAIQPHACDGNSIDRLRCPAWNNHT